MKGLFVRLGKPIYGLIHHQSNAVCPGIPVFAKLAEVPGTPVFVELTGA